MSHVLTFDVSSSRFYRDKKTHEEPRVVRIAWLRDDGSEPVFMLIKPAPGTSIDPATFRYHGLTIERLEQDGVDADGAVAEFRAAAHGCLRLISFNQDYHLRNLHRLMGQVGAPIPTTAVCVMKLATPILAIPAMRPGGGLKPPNLREACDFFGVAPPSSAPPANLLGFDTPADEAMELAFSTVRAVRGVYEAIIRSGRS